jgi:uncharacterized protein (DUF1697 family)
MPRYVAFLRAVNVGGRVVKMDELRRLFTQAGFDDVETFIASGNVIFSAPSKATASIEQTIEGALASTLGYAVPTFVRTVQDVVAAAAHTPFHARDVAAAGAYLAAFVKGPLTAAGRRGLAALESSIDRFAVNGREIYWLSTPRQSESKLTLVKFERAIGGSATMRSMTSLGKLAGRHCR